MTLPALTVRQLIEFSGVYNLAKPGEWKSIVDLDFIGCMLTPGGGKNDIPNRAKRHFHVMNITLPAVASIFQIFGSMTAVAFKEGVVPLEVSNSAQRKLVSMTLDIWQKTKAKMLPIPFKFYYIFVSAARESSPHHRPTLQRHVPPSWKPAVTRIVSPWRNPHSHPAQSTPA